MLNRKSIIVSIALCFIAFLSVAQKQDKEETAFSLAKEAVISMDAGEYDKAIKLLKKARKLVPTNYVYTYEIAVAHFRKSDFPAAIEEAKNALSFKDAKGECFQLLGTIYSVSGDFENAVETFNKGIGRYPNSGGLHAELGVAYLERGFPAKAKSIWTKGIDVAPNYPNNYYFLTGYHSHLEAYEEVIVLGEIFRNLDQHSDRSREISNLIFVAYENLFLNHNFSTNSTEPIASDLKVNFDIQMLLTIRREILPQSSSQNDKTKYLLDLHQKLIEVDLLEPYEYWLFMSGDEAGFASWYEENEQKFKSLSFWLLSNKIRIDE